MAKIIFWALFFTIVYTYCGYISLCILLGIIFNKRLRRAEIYPSISLIIPCYNEEAAIRRKIENSLSLEYPNDKLQIIVASESTDKSNDIVSEFKEKGVQLYAYEGRHGKTVLLFNAAEKARNEILVFSDANVMLKKDVLKKIAENFYEDMVGAVTGILMVDNPKASAISWGEYIYKKYETILRMANSRLGRVLNSDGALFAIRKKLYSPISPQRGDDFELVIRVLLSGWHSVFEPEAISYEDASVTTRQEAARKIRMVSWFIKSSMILIREMLSKCRLDLIFQIVSHKLLRWYAPYFFIFLFISNIMLWKDGLFYRVFLLAQILAYLMGILGLYISEIQKKKPPLLLRAMHYFLMFNYSFLIGTIKGSLSEKPSPVWVKTRS